MKFKSYFKEIVPFKMEKGDSLAHKYTIKITKAVYDDEVFEVFKKYEEHVHGKEDKSKSSYSNFLCENPLYDPLDEDEVKRSPYDDNPDTNRKVKDEGVWPKYRGGYHMIHRIDGEVAIVGVLDITDTCLSSVYLFYNPKFEFLSPGTLAALREIEYVKMAQEKCPEFKYYYMGLYY